MKSSREETNKKTTNKIPTGKELQLNDQKFGKEKRKS